MLSMTRSGFCSASKVFAEDWGGKTDSAPHHFGNGCFSPQPLDTRSGRERFVVCVVLASKLNRPVRPCR